MHHREGNSIGGLLLFKVRIRNRWGCRERQSFCPNWESNPWFRESLVRYPLGFRFILSNSVLLVVTDWYQRLYQDRSQSLVCMQTIDRALRLVAAQSSTALEPSPWRATQQWLVLFFIHVYMTSSLHVKANPLLSIATYSCSDFDQTTQRRWNDVRSSSNVNHVKQYSILDPCN